MKRVASPKRRRRRRVGRLRDIAALTDMLRLQ